LETTAIDILDKIISNKNKEVEELKGLYPTKLLEKSVYFNSQPVSLKSYLKRQDLPGIIAEIKRKSPSKGMINEYADVERISIGYMQAGASALSILTDSLFFGGNNEDLKLARKFNYCPILRKDFMLDEYQIIESKSIGADVILLIAGALKPGMCNELGKLAKSLGMEVLLEVRNKKELDAHLNEHIDVVGVNNRNLKDFSVSIDLSVEMADMIPSEFMKISESGISDPKFIHQLKDVGYDGFLIGESFMQSSRPHIACAEFIKRVKEYND